MKFNLFDYKKCVECDEKVVCSYSMDETKEDGTYRMKYYCQTHGQAVGRAYRLWELNSFTMTTNEHGGLYMKPNDNFKTFSQYLADKQPEPKESIEQISLFI